MQIETIEEMTGTMDPKSNFTLVVLQTELERFKFLVRSFLRARIAKVGILAQSAITHCCAQALIRPSRSTNILSTTVNTPSPTELFSRR